MKTSKSYHRWKWRLKLCTLMVSVPLTEYPTYFSNEINNQCIVLLYGFMYGANNRNPEGSKIILQPSMSYSPNKIKPPLKKMRMMLKIVFLLLGIPAALISQNVEIKKNDFNKIINQINDSLPNGWSVKADQVNCNKITIFSDSMVLFSFSSTYNSSPSVQGQFEINISIVPRVSPDSINATRKRNNELRNSLPLQISKANLANWHKQNEKTLKILETEPTNYDNRYGYRIIYNDLITDTINAKTYINYVNYLNRIFKRYPN